MKRVYLLFYFVIITLCSAAQTFTVKTIRHETFDLSATSSPQYDLNGKKCGLVKVQCVLDGLSFKGNIIDDVIHRDGEYWVYMTEGSKQLSVHHPLLLPINIHFSDSISHISGGNTYRITLSIPKELYASIINNTSTPDPTTPQTSPAPASNKLYNNTTINGIVVDENGEPMIGCSILIKETSYGIISDIDGKFTLNDVKVGQTITLSYVGMKTKEITFTGKVVPNSLNVILKEGRGKEKEDFFYDPNDTSTYFTLKGEKLSQRPTKKGTYLRVMNGIPERFTIK